MILRNLHSATLTFLALGVISCFGPESNKPDSAPENDNVIFFTEPYARYLQSVGRLNEGQFLNLVVLPFMEEYWDPMDSPNLVKSYFDRKPSSSEQTYSILESIESNKPQLVQAIHHLLDDYRQGLELNDHYEIVVLPSHYTGNGLVGKSTVIIDKNKFIIIFLDTTSANWRTELLRKISFHLTRSFIHMQEGGDLHNYRLADLVILEGKSHFIAARLVPEAIPSATQFDAQYFAEGFYANQIKTHLNSTLENVIAANFNRDRNRASWFGLHMVNRFAFYHQELNSRRIADTSTDEIIREYYAALEKADQLTPETVQ